MFRLIDRTRYMCMHVLLLKNGFLAYEIALFINFDEFPRSVGYLLFRKIYIHVGRKLGL